MKVSKKFKSSGCSIKDEIDSVKLRLQAERLAKEEEIPLPACPAKAKVLDFPDDVTEVPQSELGKYLGEYEAHAAWVRYQIACKEIEYDHGTVLMDYIHSKVILKYSGKQQEVKAQVATDPLYLDAKMEFIEIESELRILKASLDALERYSRTISREITNRIKTLESIPPGRCNTQEREHTSESEVSIFGDGSELKNGKRKSKHK